jgi:flagellar hook-associated protein 3 FlgL
VEGYANVSFRPGSSIEVAGMSVRISGQPAVGDRFFVETTNKQDMLTTVQRIADGLNNLDPAVDPQSFQELLDDSLTGLDNATNSILSTQAEIGARLNTIDSTRSLHDSLTLEAKSLLSDIEDLDFAEAASRLSFQSFLLEAAQQSFVRVSGLSLFNAMR